jgi:hypothetical protein
MKPGEALLSCAKLIAPVAVKGAFYVYLFPEKKLRDSCAVNGCPIESYPLEDMFSKVFMPALREQLHDTTEISMLERHVLMLPVEASPFFAVDHKYALYKVRRQSPPVDKTYCLGLLPFGDPDNAFILPLKQEFKLKFNNFVHHQLQKAAQSTDRAKAAIYGSALEAFTTGKTG